MRRGLAEECNDTHGRDKAKPAAEEEATPQVAVGWTCREKAFKWAAEYETLDAEFFR